MDPVETYQRKSFRVQAAQVTSENMEELAKWCRGEVAVVEKPCVSITPPYRNGKRPKKLHAYEGDWLTCLVGTNSFKVYRNSAFKAAFEGDFPLS